MSVETKIDSLHELVTKQNNDIQSIKEVLAGDEYGSEGLIKEHKTLKERFYETRQDVRKIKIIGGVASSVIGGLIALLSWFE